MPCFYATPCMSITSIMIKLKENFLFSLFYFYIFTFSFFFAEKDEISFEKNPRKMEGGKLLDENHHKMIKSLFFFLQHEKKIYQISVVKIVTHKRINIKDAPFFVYTTQNLILISSFNHLWFFFIFYIFFFEIAYSWIILIIPHTNTKKSLLIHSHFPSLSWKFYPKKEEDFFFRNNSGNQRPRKSLLLSKWFDVGLRYI